MTSPGDFWERAKRMQDDYVAEFDRLRARADELERALRWYAERRNYLPPAGTELRDGSDGWVFEQDSFDGQGPGARARAALGEQPFPVVSDEQLKAMGLPTDEDVSAAIEEQPQPVATYPATPVDCLISELRDGYGFDLHLSRMTRQEFEGRVAQFKAEVQP